MNVKKNSLTIIVKLQQTIVFLTLWLSAMACSAADADNLQHRQWEVEGIKREALVFVPASAQKNATPVIFAFHGHGETMMQAATNFAYHKHWPEAIAVYMQGIKTPSMFTDPEGKRSGWQRTPIEQNDRDLKFFDTVLATHKKEYKVDDKRIYATGHSNGGFFTYLLCATRGDVLAAIAPSGALAGWKMVLTPMPVFHAAGKEDPVIYFKWQKPTIDLVRYTNNCEEEGKPWEEQYCTIYPSKTNIPLVTYIHPGGHEFPPNFTAFTVKFFKTHARP